MCFGRLSFLSSQPPFAKNWSWLLLQRAAQSLLRAHRRVQSGTMVKCGGKGKAAFEKPGPASPFKEAAHRSAKSRRSMAQAAALGNVLAEAETILDEHPEIEWRERAKSQLPRFVTAALQGTKPEAVSFMCSKCTASGHAHHFMCVRNKRPKERDERVKGLLKFKLRKVAEEVKRASAVRAAFFLARPALLAHSTLIAHRATALYYHNTHDASPTKPQISTCSPP